MLLGFITRIKTQWQHDKRKILLEPEEEVFLTTTTRAGSREDEDDEVVNTAVDSRDLYGFSIGNYTHVRKYYKVLGKRLDKMRTQNELLEMMISQGVFTSFEKGGRSMAKVRKDVTIAVREGVLSTITMPIVCQLTYFCRDTSKAKSRGSIDKIKIYQKLFENYNTDTDAARDIQIDIPRTFPGSRNPTFIPKLEHVLVAYSLRNPKLGYHHHITLKCTLLIFMEEEEAFWMLVYLVEELLPNYYALGMSGVVLDTRVFEHIVEEELPVLWNHFKRYNFDLSLITTKWFLSLFIGFLPHDTVFLIWDALMLDGVVVIFEYALAILRLFQPMLLNATDPIEGIFQLSEQLKLLYDSDLLINQVRRLDPAVIEELREHHRPGVEKLSKMRLFRCLSRDNESVTKYHKRELKGFWEDYIAIDPYLQYGMVGLGYEIFVRVIRGTFSSWGVDDVLLKRLFNLFDKNGNRNIDFWELVSGLSIMCRGSFDEKANFVFKLYDSRNVGSMTRTNLRRLLSTVYSPYYCANFGRVTAELVTMAFAAADLDGDGVLSIDEFKEAMLLQPRALQAYSDCFESCAGESDQKHPVFDSRKTFYYWVFDVECPTFEQKIKLDVLRNDVPTPKKKVSFYEEIITKPINETPRSFVVRAESMELTLHQTTTLLNHSTTLLTTTPQQLSIAGASI